MKSNHSFSILSLTAFLSLTACSSSSPESVAPEERIGSLPIEVLHPQDNPSSPEKVELGRMLFWDPILSGNRDVACVTCHHPDNAYAEHLDLSIGVGGIGLSSERELGTLALRNSPTILNTAFNGIDAAGHYQPDNTVMFWDNRDNSLEAQALGPIKSAEEMRGDVYPEADAVAIVAQRLSDIPRYRELFSDAFGDDVVNGERIAKAIASFERSLVSNNSRFDHYARGDDSALNAQELRNR